MEQAYGCGDLVKELPLAKRIVATLLANANNQMINLTKASKRINADLDQIAVSLRHAQEHREVGLKMPPTPHPKAPERSVDGGQVSL